MTIINDTVVAIDYCLKNSAGEIIDSSDGAEPLEYLHGHQNIIPGLEKALDGKKADDAFDVVVDPESGYGEYNDSLVMDVPRENFPDGVAISVGTKFEAESPGGYITVTVTKVGDGTVTVDANHPLAGETLFFSGKVISVRDATQEEIDSGLDDCDCGCEHDHDSCGCDCAGCH